MVLRIKHYKPGFSVKLADIFIDSTSWHKVKLTYEVEIDRKRLDINKLCDMAHKAVVKDWEKKYNIVAITPQGGTKK